MTPEEAAHSLGFGYERKAGAEFRKAWSVMPEVAKSGKIRHVIFGESNGIEVTGFETRHTIHTGQVPITVVRTVYSCSIASCPSLSLSRRGFIRELFYKLGWFKGVTTGDSAFDLKWRVRCKDEEFVRELLTDAARAHIRTKISVSWRLDAGRLCLSYAGTMRGDRIGASIERLLAFHSLLPADLRSA